MHYMHAGLVSVVHCHYILLLMVGACTQAELHRPYGEEGSQVLLRAHSCWRHSGLGLLCAAGQALGDRCCGLYGLPKHHAILSKTSTIPGYVAKLADRQEVQG